MRLQTHQKQNEKDWELLNVRIQNMRERQDNLLQREVGLLSRGLAPAVANRAEGDFAAHADVPESVEPIIDQAEHRPIPNLRLGPHGELGHRFGAERVGLRAVESV